MKSGVFEKNLKTSKIGTKVGIFSTKTPKTPDFIGV
jgi:hypothetical protein